VRLERCLERRFCYAASVVRNRGRGNDSDDFERKVFAETGRDKSIDILIVETTALFDQCFCQSRQRGELAVLRQTTLTNGLNVLWFEPFLERQSCVERPPWTFWNRPTRLLIRTGDVDMAPAMFGSIPKADCNCCSAGLERSGAEAIVLTGKKFVICVDLSADRGNSTSSRPVGLSRSLPPIRHC
jgi:hypothetical protein